MICVACGRGFHKECLIGCKKCHAKVQEPIVVSGKTEVKKRLHGSTAKDLKDPKSTGRKRAAILFPLDDTASCEWQGKKNCGGGKRPIIGCLDGMQKHRHHGPVKDTTRNHEGNVHRICTSCHNHWHELNDLQYDANTFSLLPHDPQEATVDELLKDRGSWVSGEMGRRFELASSRNKKWKAKD